MASAEVQIEASGTVRPDRVNRAARSRGVKIELLVNTKNGRSLSASVCRNSAAPGNADSSRTKTPSISVSQHWACERTGSVSQDRPGFTVQRSFPGNLTFGPGPPST